MEKIPNYFWNSPIKVVESKEYRKLYNSFSRPITDNLPKLTAPLFSKGYANKKLNDVAFK